MKTKVLTGSILLAVFAVYGIPSFAENTDDASQMLQKERDLIGNVEITADEPEQEKGFLKNLSFNDEAKAEEQIEIPLDIGEEAGFWTQLKKAFAYKPKAQREDNKRQVEISVLMIEGRELFRNGEYKDSLETFKEVIQRDPYNISARRYIRDCQEKLTKISLDDFDIVRSERLQDVEKAWFMNTEKEQQIIDITGQDTTEAGRPIDKDVKQVIDEVRFTGAKLAVVFESLYQMTNPKVSIVPPGPTTMDAMEKANQDLITLQLQNIPLLDVIKYICNVKGLVYRVDDNAIVISGKDAVRLRTKVFQLSRSLDTIELPEETRSPSDKVQALFKKIGVPQVEGATVTYDTRRNQMIVRNTDANLNIIEDFIAKFDRTPPQVEIEARFVTIKNDNMSQLVFRHFLTKNFRWDRSSKYGDKYYIEAPNKQREVTSGLRYIRSFMDETSFDPLASAYDLPSLVSTGNEYEDYLRSEALRPHQPGYLDSQVNDVENLYSTIEQQAALVNKQKDVVSAYYNNYQNFLRTVQPAIVAGGPKAAAYQSEVTRLYGQYQNALTNGTSGLIPSLTTLDLYKESLRKTEAVDKSVNDGLGKIFDVQGVLGPAEFRSVIYALDNSQGVDTIFAPKVTVVNGQRAELKDVIRIRYNKTIEEAEDQDIDVGDVFSVVYDYAVTPKDWENREYGTRLIVTPSVQTDERTIELDVQPEVSDLKGFRRFVSSRNNEYKLPQFFVQSVKTVVHVNDGDTLVMGGLMTDQLIRTEDKTPILGDLPLIGRYWRGESEVATKANLLIFINAKLIDPSGQPRRVTASR